jgi:hypothetical protein
MPLSGREKVEAAATVSHRVLADIGSAARRIERMEADVLPNTEGVLTNPEEVAAYCETIASDLMRAAARIREAAWPSSSDYYETPGLDIPA